MNKKVTIGGKTSLFRNTGFRHEYFLLLLPFFFVLHYYVVNYPYFEYQSAGKIYAIYTAATLLFTVIFFFVLGSFRKSSVFSFFIMAFQFFCMPVYEFLIKKLPGTVSVIFLIIFALLFFLFLFLFMKSATGNLYRLVGFLNFLIVLWIGVEFFKLADLKNYLDKNLSKSVSFTECRDCKKPDVYLILLDEYAGQQALVDHFNYDNKDFLSYLKNSGFHVVPRSKSNYNLTLFSMASLFSMDTVPVDGASKLKTREHSLAGLIINETAVGKFFQRNGYEIHNLSIFEFLNQPIKFQHSYLRNYGKELHMRTLFGRLFYSLKSSPKNKDSLIVPDIDYNKSTIDFLLNRLPRRSAKPKFVYTHLLLPHFPYYYDETGKTNPQDLWLSPDAYVGYLKYCNQQLKTIIKKIQDTSNQPPIILLMSDHGYRNLPANMNRSYQFMNINAVYLPDGNYEGFYEGMSNVNQFRTLFNTQFGQKLELLADSSYFLIE